MNTEMNKRLVVAFGDETQLNIGTECGSYAKNLTKADLARFCEVLNEDSAVRLSGYEFIAKYNQKDEKSCILLRRPGNNLRIPIKLLDHTVYFAASEDDWSKLDNSLFDYVLRNWRKFLANKIAEYREHFNSTVILSRENTNCI